MSTVKNIIKVYCNLLPGHTVKEIRHSNDNINRLQTRIMTDPFITVGTSLGNFLNFFELCIL